MANNDRIRVAGYAKRIFFDDQIEYRPFSPDIVGGDIGVGSETSIFTSGNFAITTNLDPKSDRNFVTNKFSNFVTITDLNLVDSLTQTLEDNAVVVLNLDKSNLNNYAYFGSLVEFLRVSLENIITTWPASLYVKPTYETDAGTSTGYTVLNYQYNTIEDSATFKINTNLIDNKFELNYQQNGTIINTFNETNDLRNITINYASYSLLLNNIEYPVLNFTGSTNQTNDYIYIKVEGNPFSSTTTNLFIKYHIKPNKLNEDKFFNSLPDFESYLLNRLITPIYTANFKYPIRSENGLLLYIEDTFTWPVSDGYNIDFNTTLYSNYAERLRVVAEDFDKYKSDLIVRFLVSDSISSFDTLPTTDDAGNETAGQKVTKTLRIYGRSFDEIRKYVTGIQFANVVTYNKQDNTPDAVLKNLARVLGWDLMSSVIEHDLLTSYVTSTSSSYSGQSVGLTAVEAETELWRRIILNTPWIWKSKGTRKAIEFLFKFIGVPNGLIKFNEYIYAAKNPIDINIFKKSLELNDLNDSLDIYNIDSNGFPKTLPNTTDMYFQKGGLWYRETGGANADIDVLIGNNPHIGPYDGGFAYINQFNSLIPNFSAVTISSQTVTTSDTILFTNYNLGLINNCDGDNTSLPAVDVVDDDNIDLSDCYVVTSDVITDPHPTMEVNACGCETSDCDQSLRICVEKIPPETMMAAAISECNDSINNISTDTDLGIYDFEIYQYDVNGNIFMQNGAPVTMSTIYLNQECCRTNGGEPAYYEDTDVNNQLINAGYVCCVVNPSKCGCFTSCKWVMSSSDINNLPIIGGDRFLSFITPLGQQRVVSVDGCNCIGPETDTIPDITDPFTGEVGFGCRVNVVGMADMALPVDDQMMYNSYIARSNGTLACNNAFQITDPNQDLIHIIR